MEQDTFKFDLVDNRLPEDVIREIIGSINTATRGYVYAQIERYEGYVTSYNRKAGGSLLSAMELLASTEKTVHVDIQEDLGEQSDRDNKFEVYLSVKGLEHYKYRMMFVHYRAISYPVRIVLSEDLADISGHYKDSFEVMSVSELENLMQGLIKSEFLRNLIQNLINEALRIENQTIGV